MQRVLVFYAFTYPLPKIILIHDIVHEEIKKMFRMRVLITLTTPVERSQIPVGLEPSL